SASRERLTRVDTEHGFSGNLKAILGVFWEVFRHRNARLRCGTWGKVAGEPGRRPEGGRVRRSAPRRSWMRGRGVSAWGSSFRSRDRPIAILLRTTLPVIAIRTQTAERRNHRQVAADPRCFIPRMLLGNCGRGLPNGGSSESTTNRASAKRPSPGG